jgi:hypothetical protein
LLIHTLDALSAQLQGHPDNPDAKADADRAVADRADADAALWLVQGRALLQAAVRRCTRPSR